MKKSIYSSSLLPAGEGGRRPAEGIKVLAFDADDTLWENETYFREVEEKFGELMEDYLPRHTTARELLRTEIENIDLYGYGIKAFILSMIETAMRVSDKTIPVSAVEKIINLGREMLAKPVILLPGVEEVLQKLQGKYRLVMATKGDLLDQERKLKKSGLEKYFHHIEIMSEKKEFDYEKLIRHLDINPSEFAMIGNSIKSDVLPVLHLGGIGIHVPFHTTWAHEAVEAEINNPNFHQVQSISEILVFFNT
jgi:putative hydrolase of the HAD superfamily